MSMFSSFPAKGFDTAAGALGCAAPVVEAGAAVAFAAVVAVGAVCDEPQLLRIVAARLSPVIFRRSRRAIRGRDNSCAMCSSIVVALSRTPTLRCHATGALHGARQMARPLLSRRERRTTFRSPYRRGLRRSGSPPVALVPIPP